MAEVVRDTVIPLYMQIAEDIKSKIERKELEANARIPTELELSEAYGVSRITIRKALELWWRMKFWFADRESEPLFRIKKCQGV